MPLTSKQRSLRRPSGLARFAVPGTGRFEQGLRKPSGSAGVAPAGALGVGCRAFLEEPEARPETGRRGLPKATAEQTAPKRPRKGT